MFSLFKHKAEDFFSPHEKKIIASAIKTAETTTSGEIRVFVESKCRYVKAVDRAKELFDNLDMHKTVDRNAVIVYIALKHRQMAIYADEGIHQRVSSNFWQTQLQAMKEHFGKDDYAQGIANVVLQIGTALKNYFPYERNDKNELSDDIVFGQ
jgi:uncharacterized membrane protein